MFEVIREKNGTKIVVATMPDKWQAQNHAAILNLDAVDAIESLYRVRPADPQARLAAAAPALLEACRLAYRILSTEAYFAGKGTGVFTKLSAAIALATE